MKLFSAEQIRQGDAYTIANEPISSLDLMERAAARCALGVVEQFAGAPNLLMLCGPGNNGGDGLVLARLLKPYFREVHVCCFGNEEKRTADFTANFNRLASYGISPYIVSETRSWDEFLKLLSQPGTVIGDALLGTGLSKTVTEGIFKEVIQGVNASANPVFSVDIPSGLFADSNDHLEKNAVTVQADVTYTFTQPKRSFLFAENAAFTGRVEVVPIGIHPGFEDETESTEFFITKSGVAELRRNVSAFSHKGTFGHALLVGGSKGKAGSILLSTKACMAVGAGLSTALVPEVVLPIIQNQAPEAMVLTAGTDDFLTEWPKTTVSFSAMGVGPGMGTDPSTARLLKNLIAECDVPLVLDADALNILSENKTWLSFLPAHTILTPHPKEFDRLTQPHSTGYERWKTQVEFSKKHNVYVVLKGANTSVSTPLGKTFFNTTGNPGMAKGGSGDALTGMLTGLCAQGYPAVDACLMGVYLHGLAGDISTAQKGREATSASDLIARLGDAFRTVF